MSCVLCTLGLKCHLYGLFYRCCQFLFSLFRFFFRFFFLFLFLVLFLFLFLFLSLSLSTSFSPSFVLCSLVGPALAQFVSCLLSCPSKKNVIGESTGSHAQNCCSPRIAGIPQPACAGPIEIHDSLPFGADNVETQPVPEADAAAMASRLSRETEFEEPNLGEEDAKLLRRNQLDLKQASKDEDGACADGQKPAKAPRGRKPKGGPKAAAKAKAKAAAKAKASSAKAKAKASAEAKAKEEGPKAKSRARKNKAADPGDAAAVPGPAAEPKRKQKKAKHSAGPEVDRAVEAADAAVATLRKPKGEKCFAKRRMPSTPFQRAKFVAIRAAFESKIKPLLTAFSAHEDCLSEVFTMLVLEVSGRVLF